jgi:two-component system response regulator PilR (NtrC family)
LCIVATGLLSLSVCTVLGTAETAQRVRFLYSPIAALFVLNALSAAWLRFVGAGPGFYFTHLILDVPLITGIVYVTGGSTSPFVFLYLLLVMLAAVLVSFRIAVAIGCMNILSYAALIACTELNADALGRAVSPAALSIQAVSITTAMFLIALGTSFLRTRLVSNYRLLEESPQSVESLSSERSELLAGFPSGVITTDLELRMLTWNQAASRMLSIPSDQQGKLNAILTVGENCSRTAREWLARDGAPVRTEVSSSPSSKHLEIVCRPTRDRLGMIKGLAFFLHDVTELRSAEERLELQERMARLLSEHQPSDSLSDPLGELIGESPVMQKVFDIIQRVAPSDATVLVTGESGTGKELVARSIHFNSTRSSHPFVAVNCGAIPENLIESELFGHKRGAFTGADSDTLGLFRQAHKGTLFLDEIGELPLLMQAKLLRALQEKSVRPVGGTTDLPVDVRIIAATNRNLKREVEAAHFREDLFYRLNVIGVHLPPLRERRSDIPLLVKSVLHRLSDAAPPPVVSPQAIQMLVAYDYPGNVRELENVLERAIVLGGDAILPEHLPEMLTTGLPAIAPAGGSKRETTILEVADLQFPVDLEEILGAMERRYLELALKQTNGAKKRAATLLGLNFRSFRYRLQKFGMNSGEGSELEH